MKETVNSQVDRMAHPEDVVSIFAQLLHCLLNGPMIKVVMVVGMEVMLMLNNLGVPLIRLTLPTLLPNA